jgi:ABC-2 type transport system permease protein
MSPVGGARAWLRALRAEWTKLRTMTGTTGLASAAIAGMVALGALITTSVDVEDCRVPAECVEDTTRLSLSGVQVGQLLLAVLGVLVVSNEYSSGMVRITLSAIPGRLRILTAKAVVLTGGVLGVGAVAALGSLLAARIILPGNGFAAPSLGHEPTLRAVSGTVLYLGLIALLSQGIALLVRDAAVALTTVAVLLYLAPMLAQFAPPDLAELMLTYSPMNAGLAVQNTVSPPGVLIGPWAGLGVLATWAEVSLLAGAIRFAVSDAQR